MIFLLVLMILLLYIFLLRIVLLLLPMYTTSCSSNHVQWCLYNNGVLAEDQGKLNTELAFSCNSWNTMTSIDFIYSTPAMQAENDGFLRSQLVL